MATTADVETLVINTIRTLSMDAVQAANSGHPGTPMALAPVAFAVWTEALRYNPDDPTWPNRDRFVLSCGHASMLLYSVLHLAGVKQLGPDGRATGELAVPLEHIKQFRQLHSRCPGHPESYETSGVETTTGPLGQGCGNSVGMALASRWLAARYNKPGFKLFDYNVYVLCSDGDLMEGVASEAASLAGHLQLSNLCWIYDDNKITIEGETHLAFSEDVGKRFEGYGWEVRRVSDANDLETLAAGLDAFRESDRPMLIIVRSHIGYGAPNKQDTHGAHGAPLGDEEIKLTKQAYGWPADEKFLVPEEATSYFRSQVGDRGRAAQADWQATFKKYRAEHAELAAEIDAMQKRELPAGWDKDLKPFPADAKGLATRVSGGKVLNALAKNVPWMVGGSADLAPSTMTLLDGQESLSAETPGGRNMHFGIREHGMGAALNGMAVSGLRPFGATFFVFSDYVRPSVRLSAIMGLPVLYIFTHDSLGVGEDGPTHQPIEHMAALRAIPHLITMRPGDANEVVEAYRTAVQFKDRPTAFALTRQNLPTFDRTKYGPAAGVARGGYVLADADGGKPEILLLATGSEVALAVDAYEKLKAEGIKARVVSLPSFELFELQDAAYRESVLPKQVTARVAIEMGIVQGWEKYLGERGRFIGMSGYGASAPGGVLAKHFGFTVDNVLKVAKETLKS
ncbi:MAG: transketolase [Planctomycetia bacterium]|nr:transketolase [Planctomycetia bacterium]